MPLAERERIGLDLGRLARLWRARLDERLAPLGLTQAKWVILLHLDRCGGTLPQRELVIRVGVEGPTLVRVLDGLERRGLIERRDCPSDRRSKIVTLTPAAAPLIARIAAIAGALREEALAGLDDEALAACHAALRRMTLNLESGPLEPGGPS